MEYLKIPLNVEALFYSDGTVMPRKLLLSKKNYTVDRIIGRRPHNPGTVSCISPIEYIVVIEGQTKKLYFEPEQLQWFSVKEKR